MDNREIIGCFVKASKTHRDVIEKSILGTGVHRRQHYILMRLAESEGLSQGEMAKQLGISDATLTVSLKKLEAGGYIKKSIDKEDNRRYSVVIAPKGEKVVQRSNEIFKHVDQLLLKGFSEREKESLYGLCKKMLDNMNNIEIKGGCKG